MFDEWTDQLTEQIQAIQTWALVMEIAAVVTALGVVVTAVTVIIYAVHSLRRQDELVRLGRHQRADEQARQQIAQAAQGFSGTQGDSAAQPQHQAYGSPWQS